MTPAWRDAPLEMVASLWLPLWSNQVLLLLAGFWASSHSE